jgi:MtN3 and saliva related transmembrane protein
MPSLLPIIGALAAICTSLSYIPQVRKALPRGSTGDLSVRMLAVLTTGLALWVCYGLVKGDWILVLANVVGGTLSGTVLVCKMRDMRAGA